MKTRKTSIEGWAVEIIRLDKKRRLAQSGEGVGPLLYRTRKQARSFASELKEHVPLCKLVVRRAKVTVEILGN